MIGIILGVAAVVGTFILKGVSPTILINLPSIMIVLVGTAGATLASVGLPTFRNMPRLIAIATSSSRADPVALRRLLVQFAERARREGLLALEADVDIVEDPFVRRGLQMVIDGYEPDHVEEILHLEIEALKRRHEVGATMFAAAGGFAPTFGILGAVMGLIAVMAHLSDPDKLAAGIQIAFIATLMAVGIANILFVPVSQALRGRTRDEVAMRRMAIVGIMAIQAGDNPRIVARKLDSFIPPALLAATAAKTEAPAPAQGAAREAA